MSEGLWPEIFIAAQVLSLVDLAEYRRECTLLFHHTFQEGLIISACLKNAQGVVSLVTLGPLCGPRRVRGRIHAKLYNVLMPVPRM